MKKQLVAMVLLVPILLLSFLISGCVDQDLKNKLIEYDEQYYAILHESPQGKEMFILRDETQQIYSTVTNFTITEVEKVELNMKKLKKDYEYIIRSLENLKVPEPMKAIHQKTIQDYEDYILIASIAVDTFEGWKEGSLTDEKYLQNDKEVQDLSKHTLILEQELTKLMREIYGKYGLDYLLTKYPTYTPKS